MIEKEPGYYWFPKREKKGLSTSWFAFIILLPAIVIIFGIVISPLITTFIYSLKNMELISANRGQFVWFARGRRSTLRR